MSGKTFKVKGIQAEMWETSFRIVGMSQVIQVGHHITQELVTSLITAVHDAVEQKAITAGRIKLVKAVTANAEKILGKVAV